MSNGYKSYIPCECGQVVFRINSISPRFSFFNTFWLCAINAGHFICGYFFKHCCLKWLASYSYPR